jgi:5'(3')-deoxyribonucleotidase
MKRLKIGLDVDGVLADFAGPAMEITRALFPTADIHNRIWNLGMTNEQADAVMAYVAKQKDFYYSLQKIPGGEYLAEAQNNHRLYFITARNGTVGMPIEEQTAHWLRWSFNIHTPTVIVTDSGKEKSALYTILKLDAFIDDKVDTVEHMRANACNCYVFNQPWNVGRIDEPRVTLVNDYLKDVEEKLGRD